MLTRPSSLFASDEDSKTEESAKSDGSKYGGNIILSEKSEAGVRGIPMFNTMGVAIPGFSTVLIGKMPPPGPMPGHETHEKHDGEKEFLIHLGNDPDDPMDLGAEGEVYLGRGKWREKYEFNKTTTVYLPCGFWHCPWHIKNIRRAMTFVNIKVKYDVPSSGTLYAIHKEKMGGPPMAASDEVLSAAELAKAKTSGLIFDKFLLPGAGNGQKDPVGGKWLAYMDCTMIAEAPLTRILRYRPERAPYSLIDTQTHEYGALFVLLGTNLSDHTDLGAEVELSMGPEKEKHTLNKSAIVYIPPAVEHGPFTVKNALRPFNFVEIVAGPELPGVVYG
jgi:hypothetical protein